MARIVEFGGAKNGFFRRNMYIYNNDVPSIIDLINEYNNTDIYCSIYSYENDDIENCGLLGPLYFDFDDVNIEANYKDVRREVYQLISLLNREFGIPLDYMEIYFSGNKGFHVLIPPEVFGITNDVDLNIKYKKLVKLIAKEYNLTRLDNKIYDRKRLFRLPNSINSKSGLRKIKINLDFLMDNDFIFILELAKDHNKEIIVEINKEIKTIQKAKKAFEYLFSPIKHINYHVNKTNNVIHDKELLPCITNILNTSIGEGKRNNTAIVLASGLIQTGRDENSIIDMLTKWNQNNNPDVRREVYQLISLLNREFGIPLDYMEIYFSGNKGFHVLIPPEVFGITNDVDLNIKYKKLVKLIAKEYNLTRLDNKIYDRKRLFRLPNSINSKSGLRKIKINLDFLMDNDFIFILELAKDHNKEIIVEINKEIKTIQKAKKAFEYLFSPIKHINYHVNKTNNVIHDKELLPCITNILNTSIGEGKRNNTAIVLASGLIQTGRDENSIIDMLTKWNQNNNPPIPDRELLSTFVSAKQMYLNNKHYGCSAIKDLDMCVNTCKFCC